MAEETMKKKAKADGRCDLCGKKHEGVSGLGHMLLGHGPLPGASRAKRTKVRETLPAIHSELEKAGYSEMQAHQITRLVSEVLRKAGLK